MKKAILLLMPALLFLLGYLMRNQTSQTTTQNSIASNKHLQHIKKIDPRCAPCFEQYVENVIDNGSNIFGYPTSPMPGGTVTSDEAKKIAAFMATLQGLKPTHPEWIQEGKYLFYGNCTGCHSNGGKGKKGYFPDLTKKPLQGIKILNKKM